MKTIKARLTFVEPLLGGLPNNKEIYTEFVASKAKDAATMQDEVDAIGADAYTEKGTTVFAGTMEGKPFIYDYQVKGFLKEACANVKRDATSKSSNVKNYKKVIDGNIFVFAEGLRPSAKGKAEWKRLYIQDAFPMDVNERPLRAQTAQGERISLARSEQIDAGASITMDIVTLLDEQEPMIREWLDYGVYKGLLQWRNAGYGRFVWDELNEDGEIIGGNNEFVA